MRCKVFPTSALSFNKGVNPRFFWSSRREATEVMRAVFGADKRTGGDLYIKGQKVNPRSPQEALRHGIGLISENRKTEGFVPIMSNAMNMALASLSSFYKGGRLNQGLITKSFQHFGNQVQLNIMDPDYLTQNLSGGNQQKVILAKWLATDVDILIFDEPTKAWMWARKQRSTP